MVIRKPAYYDTFRCIASACPDSCCREWEVQVDPEAAAYYRALPGVLGDRLRSVLQDADGETVMTIEDGRCPMWRADGLCRIQAELGEQALCHVCREFPRLRHDYGDFVELGLELSCPEAARILLSAPPQEYITEETGQSCEAEYDGEAMQALLATRRTARAILSGSFAPNQALALLLLYGYQAQEYLDGGEAPEFDPQAELDTARRLAREADLGEFLQFFAGLELLTDAWPRRLRDPSPRPMDSSTLALARYLTDRYWLQAVSDYDLVCRVKLIVSCCLLVSKLGGDYAQTAQLFSKEIENDADNVDALLDAAYTCPAMTDDKLLGMLLGQ